MTKDEKGRLRAVAKKKRAKALLIHFDKNKKMRSKFIY